MELGAWCAALRDSLNNLSMEVQETVLPYMVKDLLTECEKAASGEPDENSNVKIALVGTFSSGKSSFLNAIFEQDLTVVDIEPTTRCRTDFTYGPEFKITNIRNGQQLSTEEYQKASRIGRATEDSHYLVLLPDPRLDGILFMDTPGFDPPEDGTLGKEQQDDALSRRAAEDADIVFFLIEAKDGTIRKDCLEYMRQLNERTESSDNPLRLAVILNKADLKTPTARQQIVDDVENICKKNKINAERIILHTSRKSKKNPDFYLQCQRNIWDLVKNYQEEKKLILGARHGVWAQLNRQSLIDLRDILGKFVEFESKQLEKKEKEFERKSKENIDLKKEAIAEKLNDLMLGFAVENGYRYANYSLISDSGILDLDCTKDFRVFITGNKNNVIPTGNTRSELLQEIQSMLNDYAISRPAVYAQRLLEDMDNLMISVFTEVDGERCGKESRCFWESDALEQVARWRNEFCYTLAEQGPAFFKKRVDNTLSSLLAVRNDPQKRTIKQDQKILSKISRLLSSKIPILQEADEKHHPDDFVEHACDHEIQALAEMNPADQLMGTFFITVKNFFHYGSEREKNVSK